jgi:predicted HNH restriction endonuclease
LKILRGGSGLQASSEVEYRLRKELLELCPDMNADGITKTNYSLYSRIRNYAVKRNIDYGELLSSWGFLFKRRKNISMSIEDILEATEKLYPDKMINSILEFKSENDTMYQRLFYLLSREKTPTKFFIEHGFVIKNRLSHTVEENKDDTIILRIKYGNYDKVAVAELISNYEFNMSEFARIVGVSRELIRQTPNSREIKQGLPILHEELEDEELDIIYKAIDNRLFKYEENGYFVRFIKKKLDSNSQSGDMALIIAKGASAKCFLDLPDDIEQRMEFKGLYKYNESDFKILNLMDTNTDSWDINERDEIDFHDNMYNSLITSGLKKFVPMNDTPARKQYIYYLTGFYPKSRDKTDSEILEIIQRNVYDIENKYVHVPTLNDNKSDYLKLRRAVKHRKLSSIFELVNQFGYIYKPKPRANRDILSEYTEIIKQFYIVEDNKVYLKTDELFTYRINSYAYKRNMSIDKLLNELGFARITREELPDGYIYRSYQSDKNKQMSLTEQVLEELEELAVNDIIDLTNNEKLNYRIRKVADMENKTMEQWLSHYGFIRKDSVTGETAVQKSEDVPEDDVQDFNEKLLEEIKAIQGTLDVHVVALCDKLERSQLLVKKLKRLYNYQCQLCDPEGIGFQAPIIEMKSGNAYVELHHIQQIANVMKPVEAEDESLLELDKYTNAIILCSHHHKYVHYHNDGYKELYKNENNEVYLRSECGDYLKLYLNQHLLLD